MITRKRLPVRTTYLDDPGVVIKDRYCSGRRLSPIPLACPLRFDAFPEIKCQFSLPKWLQRQWETSMGPRRAAMAFACCLLSAILCSCSEERCAPLYAAAHDICTHAASETLYARLSEAAADCLNAYDTAHAELRASRQNLLSNSADTGCVVNSPLCWRNKWNGEHETAAPLARSQTCCSSKVSSVPCGRLRKAAWQGAIGRSSMSRWLRGQGPSARLLP